MPRADRSSRLDLVSLVAGLLAVALGGLSLLSAAVGVHVHPAAVVALVAVALGAGGLVAAVRRALRPREDEQPALPPGW